MFTNSKVKFILLCTSELSAHTFLIAGYFIFTLNERKSPLVEYTTQQSVEISLGLTYNWQTVCNGTEVNNILQLVCKWDYSKKTKIIIRLNSISERGAE